MKIELGILEMKVTITTLKHVLTARKESELLNLMVMEIAQSKKKKLITLAPNNQLQLPLNPI